jgi:hypothetical protein
MYHFVGSLLNVEWTNQHGCGYSMENLHCQVIMQYMCDPESPRMRNGATTETSLDPEYLPENLRYGKHETYEYYADCKTRRRNMRLFTADQQVNGMTARFTRQNPNGNRRGYECPEERDYYPYWHPTPWRDIAILTDEFGLNSRTGTNRCPYYKAESQNTNPKKGYCSGGPMWNNEVDCARGADKPFVTTGNEAQDEIEQAKRKASQGVWMYAEPWRIEEPECFPTQWSRDNHLGNGIDGYPVSYNWTIPDDVHQKCVFRLRYNISTDDYDGWNVTADFNGALSPVKDNPKLDNFYGLRLAINTDQFGRTFQDRSHIFEIRARPASIDSSAFIQNINVRGKRGNIVQVYPGVEYDFVPNEALVAPGDYVHFQWTGSNTNPQGNDGEGVAGSDRSNIAQLREPSKVYPAHSLDMNMWLDSTSVGKYPDALQQGIALTQTAGNENSPYFDAGLIRMNAKGTFHYYCTRNNNFSNRDQKARLTVTNNAFIARGYNAGANWRFRSKSDEIGQQNRRISTGGLIAAIVAPCAVLLLAGVAYMVWKKPSGSDADYRAHNGPSVPPRV